MDDGQIVALYFARSEQALAETEAKYGRYCHTVAVNILPDGRDAAEAVSDAYMAAWTSIPPHRPEHLGTYLAKLTRRAALKRWRAASAQKRGGGQTEAALEELAQVLPGGTDPALEAEGRVLAGCLDRFLAALPETERRVFLRRYWYLDPIGAICARYGFSQSKVKSMLARTRAKLAACLQKEGFL